MRDEVHSPAVLNSTGRALLGRGTWHWARDWSSPSSLLQTPRPREEKAGVGTEGWGAGAEQSMFVFLGLPPRSQLRVLSKASLSFELLENKH